jgi:UDP-glucose 4-epimerase
MSKALVLGANGFIGSHLVDALVEKGHTVRAFGHFADSVAFDATKNVEIFSGDFLNRGDLNAAVKGMEYVFHFISTTTPATAESDPLIDVESNIKMSIELFKACADANIKRVIFASTGGAIYAGESKNPHTELDLPQPISPYAIGKLTIEHYLHFFKVVHGLDSISFRISNPYGERQPFHRKQGVIPIFLEHLCRGEELTIIGDGSMVRDYMYVRDLVSIIAETFDRPAKHTIYNLGSGVPVTVNEIVEVVRKVTGIEPKIIYQEQPATYLHRVVLNTERFANDFGILPVTDMIKGVEYTYKYIKEQIENEPKGER